MAKPKLKTHFFHDCPNMVWDWKLKSVTGDIATSITTTTCGQCKGRILNTIRDRDWTTLESMEVAVLMKAAVETK